MSDRSDFPSEIRCPTGISEFSDKQETQDSEFSDKFGMFSERFRSAEIYDWKLKS